MNASEYIKPIGPWPRTVRERAVRVITAAEMKAWTLFEDEDLLVVDKPGDVVCHPSKDGPWSSLVGAAREYLGVDAVHLIFRLDRETSGVVVLAKNPVSGRRLQTAAQNRQYEKTYFAILEGQLAAETRVDQALADDYYSPVAIKSHVVNDGTGQSAVTIFQPLSGTEDFTLVRVKTETGRKHQIRAHAQWLKHPLVGDKIYGPDPLLFLEFVKNGWTADLERALRLPRQALHCAEIDLRAAGVDRVFTAPLPDDLCEFCARNKLQVPAVAQDGR